MSDRTELRLVPTTTHGRVLTRVPDRPAGLLLGFHGYMENAEIHLRRLTEIPQAEPWLIASVQALHRFYRGRSEEVVASWMTRQDRETMIADNIEYANAVVAAITVTRTKPLPIVCAGFSQGGAMAFRAGVRGSFATAAIVSVGADVPPELLADPASIFPRVLFARGRRDEWLTESKFDRDVEALRSRGCAVQPLVYDAAHEWTAGVSAAVGELLEALKSA